MKLYSLILLLQSPRRGPHRVIVESDINMTIHFLILLTSMLMLGALKRPSPDHFASLSQIGGGTWLGCIGSIEMVRDIE